VGKNEKNLKLGKKIEKKNFGSNTDTKIGP
jgi:hypothetical protein